MIKKVLLAYDGSEGSRIAAAYTVELARHYPESEVTVLTVGGPLFGAAQADRNIPHMNEHEYERLADEGLALLADNGIRSHKVFRWVDPADEILKEASQGNYDLIVMGHRSASQSLRREAGMLGSVAIRVINYAPCSVLVVRPGHEILEQIGPVDEEDILTVHR